MNRCLLVSYGELRVNSSAHVLAFARALDFHEWSVSVAFLRSQELPAQFDFFVCDGAELRPCLDPAPFDVVHVWTPRMAILEFLDSYRRLIRGRLLLHLEDDEDAVLAELSRGRLKPSLGTTDVDLRRLGLLRWSSPLWSRVFARHVDGVTLLTPHLSHFLEGNLSAQVILPPVLGLPTDGLSGAPLSIKRGQILFSGTINEAVEADFLILAEAVGRLVRAGRKVVMVRTGSNGGRAAGILARAKKLAGHFEDYGYLADSDFQALLLASDILVQPGTPTQFNRGRFPAKLTSYLTSGRPVVMPALYAWCGVVDGVTARLLYRSDVGEMEGVLKDLIDDPVRGDAIGERSKAWARGVFSSATQGAKLSAFYAEVLRRPRSCPWDVVPRLRPFLAWKTAADFSVFPFRVRSLSGVLAAEADSKQDSLLPLLQIEKPLVSVIVPCFNHRRYLAKRLASISAQTYRHLEVILLDDASTDGSGQELQAAELPFPTHFEGNNRNSGNPFSQWAKGLQRCRGEFVWIAESDDEAEPEFVQRLLAFLLIAPSAGLAFCQSVLVSADSKPMGFCRDFLGHPAGRWDKSWAFTYNEVRDLLLTENFIPNASACLFRRGALERALGVAERLTVCGDWAVYRHILRDGGGGCYVREHLNRYRQHDGSVREMTSRSGRYLVERCRVQASFVAEEIFRHSVLEETRQQSARLILRSLKQQAASLTAPPEWWRNVEAEARGLDPHFAARVLYLSGPDSGGALDYLRGLWRQEVAAALDTAPHPALSRVLVIVTGHLAAGGAEHYLLEFLREAKMHLGLRICVVSTRNGHDDWRPRFADVADEILSLAAWCDHGKIGEGLRRIIASRQPSMLGISHSEVGYHYVPQIRASFPNLPIFDFLHLVALTWRQGGFPALSATCGQDITARVVVSRALREWLLRRSVKPDSIEVIYAGVRPEEVESREDRKEKGPLRLIFVGRLVEAKQPRHLGAVADRLKTLGVSFEMHIIGDGPEREWLVGELLQRHPLNVVWHGELPQGRVAEVLCGADYLVLPSKEEGLALVLMEAMQKGVIPLATRVGGQEELVTAECGLLFPVDDALPQAIVDAVVRLEAASELKQSMRLACRKRITDSFSSQRFSDGVVAFLQRLLPAKPCAGPNDPAPFPDLSPAQQKAWVGPARFSTPTDEWQRALARGNWLIRWVSRCAAWARRSTFAPWVKRLEAAYGDKLGRLLIKGSG